MGESDLSDYARRNREHWTENNAPYTDSAAHSGWMSDEIRWGMWGIPEKTVRALPPLPGRDVVELGCGTAYFSAWLKKAGARRALGVDVTPAQIATARRLEEEFQLGIELLEAGAEAVPMPDATFDLALSEYGASIWCDPHLWIPEAARLLRPGGRLVFLRNSTLATLCSPDTGPVGTRLERPHSGLGRIDWPERGMLTTEFHHPTGDMVRILRRSGFELLDLIELRAGPEARDHPFYDYVSAEWARQWPAEEIWVAAKKAASERGG